MPQDEYSIEKERAITFGKVMAAIPKLEPEDARNLQEVFSDNETNKLYSDLVHQGNAPNGIEFCSPRIDALSHLHTFTASAETQIDFVRKIFYLSADQRERLTLALRTQFNLPPLFVRGYVDKKNFPSLVAKINSPIDFREVMQQLSKEQRVEFFKNTELIRKLKDPAFVSTTDDLINTLFYLKSVQIRELWCDHFYALISSCEAFLKVNQALTLEKKLLVLFGVVNLNPDKWCDIIKNRNELIKILSLFPPPYNPFAMKICQSLIKNNLLTHEDLDDTRQYVHRFDRYLLREQLGPRVSKETFLKTTPNTGGGGMTRMDENKTEFRL